MESFGVAPIEQSSQLDLSTAESGSPNPFDICLDSQVAIMLEEEEIQSVIGVCISQAQSRLMSPRTPAQEKVAALDGKSTCEAGYFDGYCGRSGDDGSAEEHELSGQLQPAELNRAGGGQVSPWTATPKLFDISKSRDQMSRSRAATESSTGILPDIKIKRFLSGLHILSLPKGSSLRDLSIFGGSREDSQAHKIDNRQKRASTLSSPSLDWANLAPDVKPHANDILSSHPICCPADPQGAAQSVLPRVDSLPRISEERRESAILNTSRPTSLRRVKSDQSLMLRHTLSRGSTLGDDSRWENVQDQVNSRFKAIVDSLQDSNIKLPSLPSLSNINFNGFRPDFTRHRASSESRKHAPSRDGNTNGALNNEDEHGVAGGTLRIQNIDCVNSPYVTQTSPKPVLSHLDRALDQLTGDVVIMGGYRGSVLRSAKPPHRQLWVPVKVGLNIRRVNLEVGLSPDDEVNMVDSIVPSGMLSHIGPVDMGRRLLKRLRGCANFQKGKLRVHDYGYDWRLSPHLLSRKLLAFLENLPSNAKDVPSRGRGATVIAHSLGGLITRHAVNHAPELFAGVLYAGTPQHCINILGPLRKGDDVLLSSRVLTAQVNFTLRTSFLLLPDDGKCFIDKQTKEEYPVNFFDVEEWKEHAFSPCIAPTQPPASQPEKKGLLGTVSGSLSSLPLPRPSFSFTSFKDHSPEPKESIPRTGTPKIDDLANPASTIIDPQLSSNSIPAPSISTQSTIPLPLALSYLQRTLASTLSFKHELTFHPPHKAQNLYPPLSILYSTSVPTVLAARVSSPKAIRCADAYDDLAFASGDGVCLAKAAMVPLGYELVRGGMVRTERGHVGLLGDLEAVGRCLVAIGEARRKGVGMGRGEEVANKESIQ